jgi:hypothetical protein
MADNSRSRGFAAKEQKLQDKLDNLQSRYGNARELLDRPGGMDKQRMAGARKLLLEIDEVKQQLKDMRGSAPKSKPSPSGPPPLTGSRSVEPAPGSQLKDKGPARSEPPVPQNRPSTVNTQSKKPLVKRIMEALGDNRTMEDAIRDRKMTEEMERERMGQKKGGMGQKKKDSVKKAYGGMGQKKKDSVKKAYGGMVKKKHGGSANKVNMKAGFTRRGCSKG